MFLPLQLMFSRSNQNLSFPSGTRQEPLGLAGS
jgi:hypothetical protein